MPGTRTNTQTHKWVGGEWVGGVEMCAEHVRGVRVFRHITEVKGAYELLWLHVAEHATAACPHAWL